MSEAVINLLISIIDAWRHLFTAPSTLDYYAPSVAPSAPNLLVLYSVLVVVHSKTKFLLDNFSLLCVSDHILYILKVTVIYVIFICAVNYRVPQKSDNTIPWLFHDNLNCFHDFSAADVHKFVEFLCFAFSCQNSVELPVHTHWVHPALLYHLWNASEDRQQWHGQATRTRCTSHCPDQCHCLSIERLSPFAHSERFCSYTRQTRLSDMVHHCA